MKRMREYWSSKVVLLGTLVVAAACANTASDVGGESHFACQSDGDCPSSVQACVKQVCQSPAVGQGGGATGTGGSTSTGGTTASGANRSGNSGGIGGRIPPSSGGATADGSAGLHARSDASAGGTCAGDCPTNPCGSMGLRCPVNELCVQHDRAFSPPQGGPTLFSSSWACSPNPCAGVPVDCSCASGLCQQEQCYTGPGYDLLCQYFAVCADPDTPIATPEGERRIADLTVGDLVYSVNHGAMAVVPIVRVGRTPVSGHSVMQVSLASGPVLKISPGHPTADGRRFGELRAGDSLDGVEIASARMIPYAPEATFDILPDSDSGAYFAGGVLVGSTLARDPELVLSPTAPVAVGASSL